MTPQALIADQLRLLSTASIYDLDDPAARTRSTQDLVRLFHGVQDVLRPRAFAEVGAYDAPFAREIAARRPQTRVLAFEGSPFNASHWMETHDYAGLGVDYRACLVAGHDGEAKILVQVKHDSDKPTWFKRNDSILPRTHPGSEYDRRTMPAVRLDTAFAPELASNSDFGLWVDVEGAVEAVFSGAAGVLAATTSLFIEVEEHPFWEGQWLFDDVHRDLNGRGFVAVARDYEYEHQFNVIYIASRAFAAPVQALLARHASRIAQPR